MNTESLSSVSRTTSRTVSDHTPELFPDAAAGSRVEMVFRLWAPARDPEARTSGQSVAQPSGVLALIEDAAASKKGVFQSTDGQVFISGLKRPTDALVIARQIQLGLQGFRARPAVHPVAVSIAIDASGSDAKPADPAQAPLAESGNPEPSHDLLTLLRLAKPAQILITHDAWQRIAALKGLPLKSFPGRLGVYEYLWTAEEKLELFQSEPQLTLAALPAASGSKPGKDTATHTTAADPMAAIPEPEARSASTAERTAEQKRGGLRLSRPVLVAGTAVVACAIAVAGLRMAHVFSSQPGTPNPPTSVTIPSAPTPNAPARMNKSEATGTASRPSGKSPAASTTPAKPAKPPAAKPAVDVEATPAPLPAPSPGCSFASDSGRLAQLGEQYRERGDYKNAERIFRQVLACEPNNAAARDGLNRTIEGEQQTRH